VVLATGPPVKAPAQVDPNEERRPSNELSGEEFLK
jgi:hypothetical protein